MTQPHRHPTLGRVDRSRELAFTFDGRRFTGHPGDTLASALIANGVHLVGRSFKYHRPRGIVSAGPEEPSALITVGQGGRITPNERATTVELHDGLVAASQNRWPSLGFDLGALVGQAGAFFPAGFYYKTFIGGPRGAWTRLYEPVIRRLAGLGRAPAEPDPDRYDKRHAHCETLVVGGGPAGLRAATEAEGRVILLDERPEPGGSALWSGAQVDGRPAADWAAATVAALAARPGTRVLTRTTAFGRYDGNLVMAVERFPDGDPVRQRLWQIRAKRVVLATGAHEQPLVFGGNDLPGVMLASAGAAYARQYGVLVGRRVVVATAGDSGHEAARALREAGAEVTIADAREGRTVAHAHGGKRVASVTLSTGERLPCDAVLMSGGWQPAVHLHSHDGGKVRYDEAKGWFVPVAHPAGVVSVGGAAGDFDDRAVPVPPAKNAKKAFVDFQNDVTSADLDLAAREGFTSVEHLKRYTTTGMATDQGKLSNINALRQLATHLGATPGEVGTTTFRPPYTPVTFGALAARNRGDLMDPIRVTPMHDWHATNGAVFEDVGQWKRPLYYARPGEGMDDAVRRECRAVRTHAGLLDASTLGKIDVRGPDAAQFLNLVYTNSWTKLEVGRCRYGVMCREDGMVFDDGVTTRTGPDRYLMTTSTGGAARVLDHLEDLLQTEWPHLRVYLTSVTDHWAVCTLTGPAARDILGPLTDVDLATAAFPHLSMREGTVAGAPARVYRISFTGELSYEVHLPAQHGLAVWEALAAHATPYGTETMHVLRAEKGYIIVGQETDGTVTPHDLGLTWAIAKAKPDWVGKRGLDRPDLRRPDRKQLVGLRPAAPIPEGAQLTAAPGGTAPVPMLGHVTSSYWSEALQAPFALALVSGGRDRIGTTVHARFGEKTVACAVVEPVFYDAAGERMSA